MRRRHLDRVVELEFADVGSDRDDPASRAADTDLLIAIQGLPADDRALLALRFVAGFDASEIAPALGISASGVRSRLSAALLAVMAAAVLAACSGAGDPAAGDPRLARPVGITPDAVAAP